MSIEINGKSAPLLVVTFYGCTNTKPAYVIAHKPCTDYKAKCSIGLLSSEEAADKAIRLLCEKLNWHNATFRKATLARNKTAYIWIE